MPLKQIQEIIFHPCPQNMLSLSSMNNDTASPVTKKAVISYIREVVKNAIDAAENKLQEIYKITHKLYTDSKQDAQVARQVFETPTLLELFKNSMGTFFLLIENHLGIAAEYLDTLLPLCPLHFWCEQATACQSLALSLLDKREMIEFLKIDHCIATWIDQTINTDSSVADKIMSIPELVNHMDYNYIIEAGIFCDNWYQYVESNPVLSKILNEDNTNRFRMLK